MLERWKEIVDELASLYADLAFNKKNEILAKQDAWTNAVGVSQSERDKIAAYSASLHTIAVFETECRINALLEEKWYIKAVLDHGSES